MQNILNTSEGSMDLPGIENPLLNVEPTIVAEAFIRKFVELFEAKLNAYQVIADVGCMAKKPKLSGNYLMPHVGVVASAFQLFITRKQRRHRRTLVAYAFQTLTKGKLREILATTGAALFYSFQWQLNRITDKDGNWRWGLWKVALDAGSRALRHFEAQAGEGVDISCKILIDAVMLGRPKNSHGHTIYLTRKELKTDELFNVPGLKVVNSNGKIEYYIKANSDGYVPKWIYQYRFAFDWEEKHDWKQVFPDEEHCGPDRSAYIDKSILKEIASEVLAKIDKDDPLYPLKKIAAFRKDLQYIRSQIDKTEDQMKSSLRGFRFNFLPPVFPFTGREQEVQNIHRLLNDNAQDDVITHCALISGLDGVGKTQLARMYASMYRECYDGNIIWIDSETKESLESCFKDLAKELNIRIQQNIESQDDLADREIADIVGSIYKRLSLGKCLIIFDNADTFEDIKSYLPLTPRHNDIGPTILITSRCGSWADHDFIKVLNLNVFTRDEALSFVKKKLRIPETETSLDEKIGKLTKLLFRFPLALGLAVAFLNPYENDLDSIEIGKNIDKYMRLYETNTKVLLDGHSHLGRYGSTILDTLRMSFRSIEANHKYGPDAIDVMERIAYYHSDHIHFYFGMKQRRNSVEAKTRQEVWKLLTEYSLISIEEFEVKVSVQKVVQEAVRLWLRQDKREETVLRNMFRLTDNEEILCDTYIWSYATEYSSLIDEFAISKQFCFTIYYLTLSQSYRAIDNIIRRLKDTQLQVDWQKLLCENEIPEDMIRDSEHFDELARSLCICYAHFQRNLRLTDKLHDLDKFLENFSKRFDKRILLETRYQFGYTLLHIAALEGNFNLVKWALGQGADRKAISVDGETTMYCAAVGGNKDILMLLMSDNEDWNCKNVDGRTPLQYALERGNSDAIEFLLERGADPKTVDKFGRNALHWAAGTGKIEVLTSLVNVRENLNSMDEAGRTPLYYAVQSGNVDAVKLLLDKGADPKTSDSYGRSATHWAAKYDKLDILMLLAKEKGNLETRDHEGLTPLHLAVEQCNINTIKFLLGNGANPKITDISGRNAMHMAAKSGHLGLLRLFDFNKETCNHQARDGKTPLHFALSPDSQSPGKREDVRSVVEFLLENGADPLICDKEGSNAIWHALRYGYSQVVTLFIERGFLDISTKFNSGQGPLHVAATSGNIEIAEFQSKSDVHIGPTLKIAKCRNVYIGPTILLHKKIDLKITDDYDKYDIHRAVELGDLDTLKLMTTKKENLEFTDRNGRTPLHLAVAAGKHDIIKLLLEMGADPKITDKNGISPIHIAAESWDIDLLQVFDFDEKKCNCQALDGRTCLHFALSPDSNFPRKKGESETIVEFLLEKGADPLISDKEGRNAVWYALKYGYLQVVKLFYARGILDISTKFETGQCPLHVALATGDIALVKFLLEMGANVNCADDDGVTPLQLVLNCGSSCYQAEDSGCKHVEIAKLLIQEGAVENCSEDDKVKLIHLARKDGELSINKLKVGHDADSQTNDRRTPLHLSAADGSHTANENMTPISVPDVLQLALDSGDFDLARSLIDKGADGCLVGKNGMKAVHLSAKAGDIDFLGRFGDNINELECKTADGWTPLHFAVRSHKKEVVDFLLDKPINPNLADNNGLPAIAYAIESSNLRIFKAFLKCTRVDISAPFNAIGITPLIHALLHDEDEITEVLLKQKKLSVKVARYKETLLGKLRITPLHIAAHVNNLKAVKILTDHYKIDVNSGLDVSWTPLQAANDVSFVSSFLITRGARVAKDNHLASDRIFKDFFKNADNQELAKSYIKKLKDISRFDIGPIQSLIKSFVK